LALQGCVEGTGPDGAADGLAAPAGAGRSVERDVEAPEVYQTSDDGLWDGRPSLGGVWVASSDVKDPERVIIRNDANGNFVIGALFRRERENPGPKLQVSSDAAAALGMLAGAPAKLTVTALKREEATPPEPETPPEIAVAEALPAAEEIATKPLDPVAAGASAALDAAEAAAATPAADGIGAAVPAVEPKKKGLAGLFQRKKKPVTDAPLDAVSNAPDVPRIAPPPTPVAAVPAPKAPAPKASKVAKPFVQIGIFSVEANANRAVATLKRAGVVASVRKSSASGKVYWRVLAGPAPSTGDRDALLGKVKAQGFPDAYLVSG
jgi:cell division septation protein DedD